jgi:hypothetical protein
MSQPRRLVGRVLRSSTSRFAVGCKALLPEVPNFGSLVRVQVHDGQIIYGLIYDVAFGDDMLVRQMIGAPDIPVEVIRDQRENRQIPIEVSILTVGHDDGSGVRQYLPPQPPPALFEIELCEPDEVASFTQRFDYFRTVLDAGGDVPADELLAASLREAHQARGGADGHFLVRAGRELVGLLGDDLSRLDGLLRRIRP